MNEDFVSYILTSSYDFVNLLLYFASFLYDNGNKSLDYFKNA